MRGGVYCYTLARQHIVHTVNLQWPNEFHVLLFLRFLILGVLKFLERKVGVVKNF